jgi:hypothetical protein
MPAGQLPANVRPRLSFGRKAAGGCLTLSGAGCAFVPTLLFASLIAGSRCPIVWGVGGLAGVLLLLCVFPVGALIVYIGDRVLNPSGKGTGADVAGSFGPFVESKAAATLAYGDPVYGGDVPTTDPGTFRGADVETVRNPRVRTAMVIAFVLAIALPLTGALARSNVDAHGLPISPSQSQLIARPEVQLVPPGAASYYQNANPASCAANGDVYTHFATPATPGAVYAWYDKSLRALGWTPASTNPGPRGYTSATEMELSYKRNTRETLFLNVGAHTSGFVSAGGVSDVAPPGTRTVFQVWYQIGPAT